METDLRVVFCTCPDANVADNLAARVVEERLAACVNIAPAGTSVYLWQKRLHRDPEHLLVIKTTQGRLERLQNRILELHPFDLPEIIVLPVVGGLPAYLKWVADGGG